MTPKVVLVGGGDATKELSDFAMKGEVAVDDGTNVPASASAAGTKGSVVVAADAIYVCVDTDTWVKAALATWT